MAIPRLHFDWNLAWRELWQKWAPRCSDRDCLHPRGLWGRLRSQRGAILLRGSRYCVEQCLERALTDFLRRAPSPSGRGLVVHRIPLGLLLLSRQQLTPEQLRTALAAQLVAGRGKIGEWLQTLGFASEQEVTAALARQWSCPLLRVNSPPSTHTSPGVSQAPQIPLTLLRSFVMVPVDYVEATSTLHMAFGEGIDYGVLYAIEQMVGCRTEPCMAVPSFVRHNLRGLSQRRGESEVVFDGLTDAAEFARIIRSYCVRVAAAEVKLAVCGPHLWARLRRPSGPPLDLLLGSSPEASGMSLRAPAAATVPAI